MTKSFPKLPVLALVLGAALLAGCGSSSSTTSTEDWANSLCSAITTFTSSVKTSTDSLKSGNLSKDGLQSSADEIKSAGGDVSGASSVLSAVTVVTGKLSTMSSQLQSTFNDLQQLDAKGELEQAFKQAPACSSLTKSSGG